MESQPGPVAAPDPAPVVEPSVVSAKVKNGVAIVITACWAGGIAADMLLKDFELSPFVYSTMLALAGSIFGSSFVKGVR